MASNFKSPDMCSEANTAALRTTWRSHKKPALQDTVHTSGTRQRTGTGVG